MQQKSHFAIEVAVLSGLLIDFNYSLVKRTKPSTKFFVGWANEVERKVFMFVIMSD